MRGKSEEGVLERRCLNNGTQVCQEKVLLFLESLSKRYTEIQEKIEWISFLDVWFATPKSDHGGGGVPETNEGAQDAGDARNLFRRLSSPHSLKGFIHFLH
jgi:hypothetical protein